MSDENSEDCDCNGCDDDLDFISKAMLGNRDHISIPDIKLHDYIVIVSYQRDDENISLWDDKFLNLEELDECVSRYEVKAVGAREAIDAAMRIDAYRKAVLMSGWGAGLDDNTKLDEAYNTLLNIGNSGLFNRMFFSEPTSIQVVMKQNEQGLINKTTNHILNHSEHTADIAEQWLKEQTEEDNGDKE